MLQPGIPADGTGVPALEPGDGAALRHPPDRHGGFVAAVGGEEELLILGRRSVEHDGSAVGLEGQGGVAAPVRRRQGRVGIPEDPQLLHVQGLRMGKDLVQQSAQQRHLPAGAVGLQCLPAELCLCRRAGTFGGKRIAHGHHGPQKDGNAQKDTQDPKQNSFHLYVLPIKKGRTPAVVPTG